MALHCDVRRRLVAGLAASMLLVACGGDDGPRRPPLPVGPTPPGGGGFVPRVVEVATGLENPWALAFLPDGRMLVTERPGRMRIVSADGTLSAPLAGVPPVHAAGQGGLLDVAIDPDFATTPWVYWSYAEDGVGGSGTAVARGLLNGSTLDAVAVIFQQVPKVLVSDIHYGSRLVFANDKTLFVTLGERGTDNPSAPTVDNAQSLTNDLGKVVRINRDGSIPPNNPYVGVTGARPGIYSIGHRNPQGAALNPSSGELWLNEHGPQGGDEINRIQLGFNYGWPQRSYGCPEGQPPGVQCQVGGGVHFPNFEEPLEFWQPLSTAPSGMMFYTGTQFPEWQNSVFVGALVDKLVWRLPLLGNAVGAREALFTDLGERIRDVRQGPDGFIYLLTDSASGRILRVER